MLPPESRVALTLRLLGGLETGENARAFLAAEATVAQRIVQKNLSVREAERLVQYLLNPPKKAEKPVDRDLLRLQEELSDNLGANVAIQTNKKGAGKITIEFTGLDQLDGILSRFQ